MKLEGTIQIAAPPEAVWVAINDPIGLAACIPGVRDVRQIDERTFEGSIRASIGPIDGDFAFRSAIVRAEFPTALVVDVDGQDSVTRSRLSAHVEAGLESGASEAALNVTTLTYRADIKAHGRLAIIGDMVLRATAGLIIGQVTRCLRDRLEAA